MSELVGDLGMKRSSESIRWSLLGFSSEMVQENKGVSKGKMK